MTHMFTIAEIEQVVRGKLTESYHDIADLEVQVFVTSLVNTFGLAAANHLLATEPSTTPSFTPLASGKLDFEQLRRDDLIRSLNAATGLGMTPCNAAVSAVESMLREEVTERAVVLEDVGRFEANSFGSFHLTLTEIIPTAAQRVHHAAVVH